MKRSLLLFFATCSFLLVYAQSVPQKVSYQAIVRNASGKLIQNGAVSVRISILQSSPEGLVVYSERHSTTTNENGLITLEIGNGTPVLGAFSDINWATGVYYLKTETDPAGGTNYTISGTSQLLSVPYSLYSQMAGNGFSGDYNDLTNKPVTDGSETKITGGTGVVVTGNGTSAIPYVVDATADGSETKILGGANISVTGSGTSASPYVVSQSSQTPKKVTITSNQVWTVPPSVKKIKVELWGASGGGGGAGAYSYSYWLNDGGFGGSGGYASGEFEVAEAEQYNVSVGDAGYPGVNAYYYSPTGYIGDTDGGNGGDTWFGTLAKAAGGQGGKRGSFAAYTINGSQGTNNQGSVTGYAENAQSVFLDIWQGIERSYLSERYLTSRPGKGGTLSPYSGPRDPSSGEAGCAVITLFE